MRVRYCCRSNQTNSQWNDRVRAELMDAGLTLESFEEGASAGPAILLFEKLEDEVFQLLRKLSGNGQERVLALTPHRSTLPSAAIWELLESGASDVVAWEYSAEPAKEAVARLERWISIDELVNSDLVKNHLVGHSRLWKSLLRRVVEVARFSDSGILLLGESGTGKELLARLIHTLDSRPGKGELIVLDCTTVVPELSGSEFFGHERGSFTGALNDRDGAFALANKGTLFLDEIGELNSGLQSELLRVVQELTYKPIGSNKWKSTDFRLVCATNRNLLAEEEHNGFRRDLFHRIAGWTCVLPPLRERTEDILPLVNHFISQLFPDKEPPQLDPAVSEYLLTREYSGNVRELRTVIERIVKRHVSTGPLTVGDIPEEERPKGASPFQFSTDPRFEDAVRHAMSLGLGLKEIGNAASETAIRIAVNEAAGNLQHAAQKLKVTDRALQLRRAAQRGVLVTTTATDSSGNGNAN
jgi:transcriptional regulator with GAF, ATPase, and Fis domain